MKEDSMIIFTDGASKGNPGPGGWGAIVVSDGIVAELGGSEMHTTNNRMELAAAIGALAHLQSNAALPISVYSDSAYLVNGITKWIHGWKKNDWRTSLKKDVENRDLWEKLDALRAGKQIVWKQVAGHFDTPGNARADEIASAYGEGSPVALYNGALKDYSVDVTVIGESGSRASRGKPFYISFANGVLMRHETWSSCKSAVEGKRGVKYKKVFSDAEADAIVSRWKQEKKTGDA